MVLPLRDDNPTGQVAWITIALIVVNFVVFAFLQPHDGARATEFSYRHAAIPCEIKQRAPLDYTEAQTGACAEDGTPEIFPGKQLWWSAVASMFMHGSWWHLLGNLLFLWVFGNNIEERFGRVGYLAFYLASGFVALGAHYLADPSSTVPVIGASGAIAGVMGAYLVLFPRARVLTWLPIMLVLVVYLPAFVVLGLWFLMQFATDPNSSVAWVAHVGGFAFGMLVAFALRNHLKPLPAHETPAPGPRVGALWDPRRRRGGPVAPTGTWIPPSTWAPPPMPPPPPPPPPPPSGPPPGDG